MRGLIKTIVLAEVTALAVFNASARVADRIIDGRSATGIAVAMWRWSTAAGVAFYLLLALFALSAAVLVATYGRDSLTRALNLRVSDGLSVAVPIVGLAASYATFIFWP